MLCISYFRRHFYITIISEFEQNEKKKANKQRNEKYQSVYWNMVNVSRYEITALRQLGFVLPYCLTVSMSLLARLLHC